MLTTKERAIFWVILVIAAIVFIHSVKSILLPFVLGIMVAYFLDPSADKLEKWGLSRGLSTFIITLIFFIAITAIFALLGPLLYNQLVTFIHKLPEYYQRITGLLPVVMKRYLPFLDYTELTNPRSIDKNSTTMLQVAGTIFGSLWISGKVLLNLIALLFITPVVAFYLLRDWDIMVMRLNNLLPNSYAPHIRKQLKEIDHTLSGFIRGQLNVCLIMAVGYSVALTILGLDFGLILGLLCGLLIFIPFVGVLFGITAAYIIALLQYGLAWQPLVSMLAIFLIGQSFETYILTPRLVGNKVGLHPVWVIFGMLAGGALLGLAGIVLSVPITAMIGVLTRFFVNQYRDSDLYQG